MSDHDAYLAARAKLIAEERSLRCDATHLQNASKEELQAEQIIRVLRTEEAESIWSVEHEDVTNTFPGMQFLSAKKLVMKSKIFQILQKMPKGGLLHGHLDAMVDASYLLKLALAQPAIHIRTGTILTAENIKTVLPEFQGLPAKEFSDTTSLTQNYTPGTWVGLRQARESFDSSLGGPSGFDAWVIGALTINPSEAYGTHNTVSKIWEKFTTIFSVAFGLTTFEPIMRDYLREHFYSSIEDGISYVEIRIAFFAKYMTRADGQQNLTHREWVKTFEEVLNEVKKDMKARGRPDEFFGARIIYTTRRNLTCEELEWYLEDCIQLKQEFPHLLAGFDLVGNENTLYPLIYYLEPLLRFKKRVAELGLELPFIFHAGETLGDGSEPDNNLYDAILLGTKRIGHGFSLAKHPKLIEMVKENGIAIEMCPISNEILRLTSSMPAHPLPILLNHGVKIALNSDDPSVFGNMGLSYDFFQVLVASEITGLITLKALARHSLEYSTLNDKDKAAAIEAWEKRWKLYIKSIVDGSIIPS
ncbi:hypothetical protein ACEPAH_4996 [Sanghuangporus vaninii]